MIYLWLLNNSTNGTINPGVGEEVAGVVHTELTMMFWAIVAVVGVVGLIAYISQIPSFKASGRNLVITSIIVSIAYYVIPGIIHNIRVSVGW